LFHYWSLIKKHLHFVKSFYIVLTGRLKLYKSSPKGREQTIQLLDRSALKRLAEGE